MRKAVLLFCAILVMVFSIDGLAQDRGSRRRPSRSRQQAPRAAPRRPGPARRAVPRPPQRYESNRRNYSRRYYYGGGWSYQRPRFYQQRYRYNRGWRFVICQPGYVIFLGYDYYGRPRFEFFAGRCNVPWHHHEYDFYDGYY